MRSNFLALCLFGNLGWSIGAYAQATPETPDRPGRVEPSDSTVTDNPAATPSRPGRATPTDISSLSDDDLLKETADDLSLTPPTSRLDRRILNYFGARPWLDAHGITTAGALTADYSVNLRGGGDTDRQIIRHLFDFRINADMHAIAGIRGGTFSVDFQNQAGDNGSDYVGDVQGFDNADSDGRTQLNEIWYEQFLFENKFRVKVGKVDANSEFAFPAAAAEFLNSSFGHSPTIVDMPTYPDPALSVNLFFYPAPWLYAGYGIYDGSGQHDVTTGDYGPRTLWHAPHDSFQIAELGVRWVLKDKTLPGHLAGGVVYDNGDFTSFSGRSVSGTTAAYALFEQKLIHTNFYTKDDQRGVYLFGQYGWASEEINDVAQHFGAGLSWVGPYEKPAPDSLGIGFSTALLSDAAGSPFTRDAETSIEAFYKYQVTEYLYVKPDFQYITNPGGDRTLGDAFVATLRVTLAF